MLSIRFHRVGKKGRPTYRVVVTEHTAPVQGRFLEDLGSFDPHTKTNTLKKERIEHWLKSGAQPSNSVARILVTEKVKHPSVVVLKFDRKPKKAALARLEAAAKAKEQPAAPAEAPEAEVSSDSTEAVEAPEVTEEPAAEVAEEVATDSTEQSAEAKTE